MTTPNRSRRAAGFTLLEVLVAFLILAVALGVLLPSFSSSFASLDRSKFYALALAEARSQIDRLGIEIPFAEGELTDVSEAGLSWVVRLHRQDDAWSERPGDETTGPRVVPYQVEVVVSDAAGQMLAIKTLRLAIVEQRGAIK
jgi:general secretion pathway protein I